MKKSLSMILAAAIMVLSMQTIVFAEGYDTAAAFTGRDELSNGENILINGGGGFENDRLWFAATVEDPYIVYKTEVGNVMRFMAMDYDVGNEVMYSVYTSPDCENWTQISPYKNRITDRAYVDSFIGNNDGTWSMSGYVTEPLLDQYVKISFPKARDWASQMFCVQFDKDSVLSDYDSFSTLDKVLYKTAGTGLTDWWYGGAIGVAGNDTIENANIVMPYISYKVETGSRIDFGAFVISNRISEKFSVYESFDGLNWTSLASNSREDISTDSTWFYTRFVTEPVSGRYVKICFPNTKWNGNDFILKYVRATNEKTFIGKDTYYSTSADTSKKINSYSMNLIVESDAWNENMYDVLCPNLEQNYYENGDRTGGFVSYKVLPGSDIDYTVYEYTGVTYDWKIEESDDGFTWTNADFTRTEKGMLVNDAGTERPFMVADLSAHIQKNYVRVTFPKIDWNNGIHAFSAYPDSSYTLDGRYDFTVRDADGNALLIDKSVAPSDLAQLGDSDYIDIDSSKILEQSNIDINNGPGWKLKTDSANNYFVRLMRQNETDGTAYFKVSDDKSFKTEIFTINNFENLDKSVLIYTSPDYVNWTSASPVFFKTDINSVNAYYSLWNATLETLPVGTQYIKIVLCAGEDNLPVWAPQLVSVDSSYISFSSGDSNYDGITDIKDLVRTKRYLAGTVNISKIYKTNTDMNKNDIIDASDAVCLKKYLITGEIPLLSK